MIKTIKVRVTHKHRIFLFSPLFFCAIFLSCYFFYMLFENAGTATKYVLSAFIIPNFLYADFVVRNYFENKNNVMLWIIEIVITALTIYYIVH